jgi:hypothetical protein
VRKDDDPYRDGPHAAHQIAALGAALQREREAPQAERRRVQRWECEAVLRASTVAGALTARVLAAQRLAAAIERNLKAVTVTDSTAADVQDVRDALRFFREVEGDRATR